MTNKPFNDDKKNQGYVLCYRKMVESELWLKEPFTRGQAWWDMVMLANFKETTLLKHGIEVTIKRGQVGWSEEALCSRWRWSRGKVRRFLAYLETVQQIRREKNHTLSRITIVNYNKYQLGGTPNSTTNSTTNDTTNGTTNSTNNNKGKERIIKDNKTTSAPERAEVEQPTPKRKRKPPVVNPLGAEIIKAFEAVDPKNKTYYGNTTQRKACDFLIAEYGLDVTLKLIRALPELNTRKLYIRQITTPYELKENWVKIGNALKQKQTEAQANRPQVI